MLHLLPTRALALVTGLVVASAALADDGDRVIVTFKAEASVMRAHALSAGATASHARTLESRTGVLAARHGLALQSGAGISERAQVMRVAGMTARDLAARLVLDPDVETVSVDRRVRRTLVPNDTLFAAGGANGPAVGQWYLKAPAGAVVSAIDAVGAWDRTTGSNTVVVAVLDTGVRPNHPDLAGKLLAGYDMVSAVAISNDGDGRDADPSDPGDWVTAADKTRDPTNFKDCDVADSSWHGTQTAGLIGAATNNGQGMAGAGWNVRVLPVRVLGKCFGYTSDIVAGIRWAAGLPVPGVPANPNPAKVINLSLGSAGACSTEEASAVAAANAAGAVVVAAAGNSAGHATGSPANCPGAIGVAAVRHVGSKVGFSDVGPELSIAAPGGNCVNLAGACLYPILTTLDTGTQGPVAPSYSDSINVSVGTSFSSPLVAGVAALMFSAEPSLTPAGVRSTIMGTARTFPSSGLVDQTGAPVQACRAPNGTDQLECYCTTSTCGAGMLDAAAAVAAVLGLHAAISVSPTAPQGGQVVTLDSSGSTVPAGRSIATRVWTLVDGGGIVTGFNGATDGATAALTPSAAGSFTVRLTITDNQGVSVSVQQAVAVSSAPGGGTTGGGGGGGGAMSWAWLLALIAAVVALRLDRAAA